MSSSYDINLDINAKDLSNENLEAFEAFIKAEIESRKVEEEAAKAREHKEKVFEARCLIWDAEKEVAKQRTAKRKKFQHIMEIIYRVNFDYHNAGIFSNERRELRKKLDRLWKAYNRTVKEYEAFNDKYEALHITDMSL